MKSKEEIRRKILEKRKNLTVRTVKGRSKKIIAKLNELSEFQNAKTIMFYVSFDNEVDTQGLIREILEAKSKTVVVPYIANEEMMISIIDFFDDLEPGTHNILEPKHPHTVLTSKLDLVIIPGVAFDKAGNRIGFGVGYYDRFLKHVDCPKIGLAYKMQIVKEIPSEDHDIKVDMVLTE